MAEVVKFKVFCLELYKYKHNMKGYEALQLFKKYGVFEYLDSFYDILHSYGAGYLVQDIDKYISTRQLKTSGSVKK